MNEIRLQRTDMFGDLKKIEELKAEIIQLREENRNLILVLDKAMVIVRSKAPRIKSELDILRELEQVELSHDVEYMRKLREAVISERANRIDWLEEARGNMTWEGASAAQAERELRAEGVIE